MPAFFLELFSEEIPARMQARGAEDLARLIGEALAPIAPSGTRTFHGPRRLALAAEVSAGVADSRAVERGPRRSAPEQALAGFLRKHGASREDLREEGDFWVLDRLLPGVTAAELIARALPPLLRRFPWPKSMRWGGTSAFTWVRPLRRITCLLDGTVVPFDLCDGDDDGHGLVAGNVSEGHRFMAPGPFMVTSREQWQTELRTRRVIADAGERRQMIAAGIATLAADAGLTVADDPGLLDEVTGLVEWPVPLLGRIDAAYMGLPAEVMQVSMRVNQRYFALREADGRAAPAFAFVANIDAADGGRATVAGNERVLRARFADARHFWDLDRHQSLESRLPALDEVTFHAKLGSQGKRVRRLVPLSAFIASQIGADPALAERAALLCKADLTTGMVGEFPELQGVMGGYYARHHREPDAIADAIRQHYAPRGPSEPPPDGSVATAVALADKLDQIVAFFGIDERPTGSGDPYALRRAALGIIRIIRERRLRIGLREVIARASGGLASRPAAGDVLDFLIERLRVQLRAEGARYDVLNAVLGAADDDDLTRILTRMDALDALLGTADGVNLLAAYRRAANILRIEEKTDGPHDAPPRRDLMELPEEAALADSLDRIVPDVDKAVRSEDFRAAVASLAELRGTLDAFFDRVTVNDTRPEVRVNRLRLLASVRAAMNRVADFSRIEG